MDYSELEMPQINQYRAHRYPVYRHFLVSGTRYRPPKNSAKYRQLVSEYLLPGIGDILVSAVQYWT